MSISSSLYGQKQAVAHESPDSTPVKQLIGQTQETQGSLSLKDFKVTFNPPAGNKPQSSAGGASRSIGQCIMQAENSNLPLTPLLPADALGLTVSSHPTVLAYLPEINANKVFFSWQDENNQEHYQTILPIANQEGIISLTLPEDAPPLEVGKNYQWALAIMCDGRLQPDSPMIQGQIQRVEVEPSVSDRLVSANALEIAAIYGEAGIWYETVATLAQLKITQPNHASLKDNWQELLASVGLEKVAATSLILKGE
ncbi:MAG: DUF928 domain-containing protein [Cyanobacteria bacterium P01_A01_bin.83]